MDPFVPVALVFALAWLGVAGFGLYRLTQARRTRLRAWSAAEVAGVKDFRIEGVPDALVGRWGTHRVRFEEFQRQRVERREGDSAVDTGIRVVVEGNSGIALRRETFGTAVEKAIGAKEIEIGDEAFDARVFVSGSPEIVRAALDGPTRSKILALLGGWVPVAGTSASVGAGVVVRDGDLVAEFGEDETEFLRSRLRGVLETLLDAAHRLEPPASIPLRIAENTRIEPSWRVRLENLRLLANNHPRNPASRAAFHLGCEDEHVEVQLQAALALGGDTGSATLLAIASRESADDTCAARAISALGPQLPLERTLAILGHALRTRRVGTAAACLDALGRTGGVEAVSALAKVVAVEAGDLAVAATRALGATKDASAEAPLLRALGHAAPGVRKAAVEALGRVGTASAVPPLKDAAEQDGDLRRAVRQAVAEIQARLSGASPGQLSLAGGDAGRLSLADEDPRGQVSLTPSAGRSGTGTSTASRR